MDKIITLGAGILATGAVVAVGWGILYHLNEHIHADAEYKYQNLKAQEAIVGTVSPIEARGCTVSSQGLVALQGAHTPQGVHKNLGIGNATGFAAMIVALGDKMDETAQQDEDKDKNKYENKKQ